MPKGGQLILGTKNVTLAAEKDLGADIKPGKYVQLTVDDTGSGMPEEILAQIFQPFFTTKSLGQGTGLGLFMVKVIVHRHQGLLSCASTPGSGTTFTIDFPVLEEKVSLPKKPGNKIDNAKTGKGTVLLVEDDESVRHLGKEKLSRSGYSVLPAESGEEALEIFRRRQDDIDLVLLDLFMPGMGGKECLRELLKIAPQAKIILMSGCDLGTLNGAMASGAQRILSKPYKMDELLQAVRQVMDQD
jgi:CheY-like chemotaxis protein